MSSEEQSSLVEISRKLDVLVALTAAAGKETDAQIDVLTSLGYRPAFIGPLLGLTPHAVSVRLSRRSKRGNRGRGKKNTE